MKARLSTLLATLASTVLLSFSGHIFAVGLGDLTVESGLNEPLKARISLVKVGDLKAEELLASIADKDEYIKRHMDRDAASLNIRFSIDLDNSHGPCIVLTTNEVVKEPSLNFLAALAWPTGNLVREYTVLLDRP
jgi:pilus assembly protein FimV